jgi:hypothetical protein
MRLINETKINSTFLLNLLKRAAWSIKISPCSIVAYIYQGKKIGEINGKIGEAHLFKRFKKLLTYNNKDYCGKYFIFIRMPLPCRFGNTADKRLYGFPACAKKFYATACHEFSHIRDWRDNVNDEYADNTSWYERPDEMRAELRAKIVCSTKNGKKDISLLKDEMKRVWK